MTAALRGRGKTALVLVVSMLFMSCATIVGKSRPEMLNVRSSPDQARIVITDEEGTKIFDGKTPTVLSLEKKKGYFSGKKYNVTLSKEGFKEHSVTVNTQVGGWYLGGNLLFGGLIGWLIVDPATGAMWTLSKNDIDAALESLPAAPDQRVSPAPQFPESTPAVEPPPSTQSRAVQPDTAVIVLLQDVPESLQDRMVRVSH
jgi:hypothetical protein